jgi:hypothetical protein
MKTFSQILAEVAQPKAGDEVDFKDKHLVQKVDYPLDVEDQFVSKKPKAPKRRADYNKGEDEAVYESVSRYKKGDTIYYKNINGTHKAIVVDFESDRKNAVVKPILGGAVYSVPKSQIVKKIGESSFEVPTAAGGEYDEEDTHKKYKSSNKSKMLHKEAKLDPVGKEDDDIDNDGDVDSSDKYLHNRRKAIRKAMKESISLISEKAKSEAQQKAAGIALAVKRGDMPNSALQGASAAMYKMSEKNLEDYAKTKHKGIPEKVSEETEQLDELSPSTLKSYMKKAGKSEKDLENQHKDVSSEISKVHTAVGKKSAAANSAHRATTQRAANKATTQYRAADKQIKDTSPLVKKKADIQRKLANRMDGMGRAAERLHKEEVELDEISKSTLSSYIKKASGNMAGNAAVAAAQASSSMKKSTPEVKRNIANRMKGITRASDKLAKEKVEQIDEISDKLKAKYLDKAVQQRYDFFKEPWDPKKEPKWATPGGKPKKGYYDQPHKVKAREKDNRRGEIIDKTAEKLTGKPHYSKMSTMTSPAVHGNASDWWKGKKYAKEEVEQIDEISKKTLVNYMDKSKKQTADIQKRFKKGTETRDDEKTFDRRVSGQVKALDKFHGRSKVPASGVDKAYDYAQKALRKEENGLTENFKAGAVKLNDGSSVMVKEQDAKLLNQLFKDLKEDNKKKMLKVAMTDKNGFNEILGFAREAL